MKLRLHVEVSKEMTLELQQDEVGDNPLYYASQLRHALLALADRIDPMVTGVYGDIEDKAISPYTAPLPSISEWTT